MQKFWFLTSTIVTFCIFSGCGDQLKTSTKDESINITKEILAGTWTSKCTRDTTDSTAAIRILVFSSTGDNLTVTTNNFSDENCSSESFIFTKVLDNLVLGETTTTSQNQIIKKFTSKVVNIALEPKSSYISSSLNFHEYCGLTGWTPGTTVSLTGLTCSSTTYDSANDLHYDIIQISSEKSFIRVGNITNTDNTDGYPKTLYSEEYYK